AERGELIANATKRLAAAGHAVYLDAGHSRWRPSGEVAERLLRSGIQYAEGFAVNVSNRQTTEDSYRWGRELSDLVGGREFVIDTSRNGAGPPPDDPKRDDEWCNPKQQALGAPPRPVTDRPGLAALLWIKGPGESDGRCGSERTYLFTPTQARPLIVNAGWVSARERADAKAARPAPVVDVG
ncbi:MAG TPA: glycoside hydrolase family 6 protein, partial [Micromonosporaceae bacterium]|nr:glycoside hydrolase family 6 protein [Micromonosporaceae bacterium]